MVEREHILLSERLRPDSYLRYFLAGLGGPPGAPHLTCLSWGVQTGQLRLHAEAWPGASAEGGPGSAWGMWLWHPGDPGLSAGLTVAPFPAQVLAAEENVDFRIHVENQTRARDDVSRKQLRLYQLYSRTSGKHIQVLGRRISARGEDGDKYGRSRCPPPTTAHTRPGPRSTGSDPSSATPWPCDLAPDSGPSWASVSPSVERGCSRAPQRALLGVPTEDANENVPQWPLSRLSVACLGTAKSRWLFPMALLYQTQV